MLFFALLSTVLLLVAFSMEFLSYIKAPHGDFEVIGHIAIDCLMYGIPIACIWALYCFQK